MSIFPKIYVGILTALIVVEIIGVLFNFHPEDTLSGNYWYIRNRFPAINIILTVGLLALWYHLVFQGPKKI